MQLLRLLDVWTSELLLLLKRPKAADYRTASKRIAAPNRTVKRVGGRLILSKYHWTCLSFCRGFDFFEKVVERSITEGIV